MRAAVSTVDGVFAVDLEAEVALEEDVDVPVRERIPVSLPRVVATAAAGSTVVAIVERRPPLAISRDAGRTWTEAGGGLPAGFAVAVDEENPDRMLYAGRNRLYLSLDGGRFWRSLAGLELPDVLAVGWLED